MTQESLRERKKLLTRNDIAAAALALFISKGFDKTTLADIAEQANVAPRTIFSYYPSKEAIIFDEEQQTMDVLFEHIERRDEGTIFDALRSFGRDKERKAATPKQMLIAQTPALQEYLASLMASFEQKLTRAIAVEHNLAEDSIQAHLVASAFRAYIAYGMSHADHGFRESEVAIQFIEAGLRETTRTT